jgi:ribose/xylose/arabinose/galactoside ABC-type transport system permease subunit
MTIASQDKALKEEVVAQPSRAKRGAETLATLRKAYPWAFLITMLLFFTVASQELNNVNFLTPRALQGIAVYSTQILLLALGETLIIISAGIDLSVAWILGFSSVIAADIMKYMYGAGYGPLETIGLGILGGVFVAVFPGLLNGILVTRWNVPSFISTLAVGFVVEGVALLRSHGYPIADQPPYLGELGNNSIINWSPGNWFSWFKVPETTTVQQLQTNIPLMPNVVFVTIIVTAICWFVLAKTQFGQHLYAIGGNFEAAKRAGIPVNRTLIKAYIFSAVLAGIAGVLWAARFTSGAYNGGETTQMFSIAAVVIGGASLFGGEGTMVGTIVGALVIATIQYGLVVLGVENFYQYVVVGGVLILAVVVDQLGRRMAR